MARARKSRTPAKPKGKKARTRRKPKAATPTEPLKAGRPPLIADTPEWKAKRNKLLKYLKGGATERAAVMAAGIGWSTYKEAKQKGRAGEPDYAAFLARCIEAMSASRIGLEMRVHKGTPQLALRVLRARYPLDWNPEVVLRMLLGLKDDDADEGRPLPAVAVRREQLALGASEDDEEGDE